MTSQPQHPEPSADGLYPDTEISALTVFRVAEIFEAEGLAYRIEPQPAGTDGEEVEILRTGFSNTAIAMQVRDDIFIIDSLWRAAVPRSEGPRILATVNAWNEQQFAPTLRFFEQEEQLVVSAVREIHCGLGLSRNQLGAFLMSTLDAIVQSLAWLEQQYPELVTWENHHD